MQICFKLRKKAHAEFHDHNRNSTADMQLSFNG